MIKNKQNHRLLLALLILINIVLYIYLSYVIDRKEFINLFISYSFLSLSYFVFLKQKNLSVTHLIILGVVFRVLIIFSIPILSDDYYRFIWDGLLSTNSINPFLEVPEYYIINDLGLSGINTDLYNNLNSPKYFSIYPPICQFIFFLSILISPQDSFYLAILIMKLFILLAEGFTIYYLIKLIKKLNLSRQHVLIYVLNPLVILELSGNLHFEALMICFLVIAIYYLNKNKTVLSGIFFGFSVCTKLLPLMFLPLFFKKLKWKKGFIYYLFVGLTILVLFIPFLSLEMIHGISNSINLYFKKFEFNASIYYLTRWVGYQIKGYNIIQTAGSALSFITFLFIIFKSFTGKYEWKDLLNKMLFALTVYFMMATIVHPWYITGLVLFSVFSNYRFAVVWSVLIVLSYAAYQSESYQENLLLVTLEYIVVYCVLAYEMLKKKSLFTI